MRPVLLAALLTALTVAGTARADDEDLRRACETAWDEMPAGQRSGVTQDEYLANCLAGRIGTHGLCPAAPRLGDQGDEDEVKDACGRAWQTRVSTNKTCGQSFEEFFRDCREAPH